MTHAQVSQRLFTLKEANALLPLVRVIARDIVELSQSVVHTRERLDMIRGSEQPASMYSEEIEHIEQQLEADYRLLQNYVQELVDLGVEPKGLMQGLVDFPAQRGNEIVCLCWQFDEPQVEHWHTQSAGFAGRQPISTFPAQDD